MRLALPFILTTKIGCVSVEMGGGGTFLHSNQFNRCKTVNFYELVELICMGKT